MLYGEDKGVVLNGEGVLRINGCLCVAQVRNLISIMLVEAHNTKYHIYLGATMMYKDLRQSYLCQRMKRNIVDFVTKCHNY